MPKKQKIKRIEVSIYWPDGWKSVILTPKEYQSILAGKPFSKDGEGYGYDGEDFQDWWSFEGGMEGKVVVSYGDDGGEGFNGRLSDCEIQELEE